MRARISFVIAVTFGMLVPTVPSWSIEEGRGLPATMPLARLVAKPADSAAVRRALPQPTAPSDAKQVPFIETAAEPVATDAETQRGYILFHRPTTEVIHANTRPLPHERTGSLTAFAAPGQFEPVTLALYPLRPLENLRVRASSLTCAAGQIPAKCVDVRLATYWNIGYPAYTTLKTYRRVPELLERVTAHSSPAGECQSYWLTIRVPDDAKPGLYRGSVTVWDDGFDRALEIPLALRVLDFRLQKDPAKHFSAYFYVRDRNTYKGRDEAFIRRGSDNEYRTMTEFGLDMLPTFRVSCRNGKIVLNDEAELERMLAAGLKGPVPVCGDSVISAIYRETTPRPKTARRKPSHWAVDPLPPPEFYRRITELWRAFEQERKAKGWPEFVYCPIDEVAVSAKEFGSKVYAAVKAAGARTYATHDPVAPDAADYAPYLDVWCSQPFSVPFEQIIAQKKHEYWCYPNHNACEIRDPQTMCKGGRMTYGFGLWRSGFTTLIPWHWSWTNSDPRDYLRGRFSGCGQRMDDDGEIIPAIYWACFRQGCDDGRYLYTLQQAIVKREGSTDPACQTAVADGRRILQETWDSIRVQPKYLAKGMWPSDEFDNIRWRLAAQTSRLLAFPAAEKKTAPSVLIAADAGTKPAAGPASPFDAAAQDRIEVVSLLAGTPGWRNGTAEGRLEATESAISGQDPGLRWTVTVDYRRDGGEGGRKYPIGWPRIGRGFAPGKLDMTRFDALQFRIRVTSDRDETSRKVTPIWLSISSHNAQRPIYSARLELPNRPQKELPLRFSVNEMIGASEAGEAAWKSISHMQINIAEGNFADGTRLVFDLSDASLLRLKSPAIDAVVAPRHVLLPRKLLAVDCRVAALREATAASHTLTASIEDADGAVKVDRQQDLASTDTIVLPTAALEPGDYRLHLSIRDAKGATCSDWAQPITAHAGPAWPAEAGSGSQ